MWSAGRGRRFCGECGTAYRTPDRRPPVAGRVGRREDGAPVAERRVTSVLFGDLVGFTPLSESRDPEEVRELLSPLLRRVPHGDRPLRRDGREVHRRRRHGGVGGAGRARGRRRARGARRARAGAATVAAMGEDVGAPGLAMRVGVVTGEVAVTVGATAEGMVAGDAVNTAARVQSVAEPGTVWVDETTRSLTAAAIAFEDAGEHALKGKTEPVRLWRAAGGGRRGRRRAAGRRAGGAADRPGPRAAAAQGAVPRHRRSRPRPRLVVARRRGRESASPGWCGSSRSTPTA